MCGVAAVVLFWSAGALAQPVTATTSDGRILIINPDGTWKEQVSGGGPVKGKVNLSVAGTKQGSSTCWVMIRLENLTDTFFQDYVPRLTAFDKSNNVIGKQLGGGETTNFRPGAIATLEVYVENIPCTEIAQIVVSGFERSCGREAFSTCQNSLNVVPSKGIPLVRR